MNPRKGNALPYQKITGRPPPRRREGSLDRNMVLVQSILDAIPIPLFCKNLDNEFVAANAAFERLTGVQTKDLLRTSKVDTIPANLASFVHLQEIHAITGAQPVSYVLVTPSRRGILVLSMRTVPLVDPNGSLGGTLGIVTSMSSAKKYPRYYPIAY